MPKIFRVHLKKKEITVENIQNGHKLEEFAGRSLSSKIIFDEVPPSCDPLGSENKLVFASGFLSGTFAPNSGRISVGGKSPLNDCVKESNVGGYAPSFIAKQDIRALVLEEISDNWVVLEIKDGNVEIKDGKDYVGLNNYDLCKKIVDIYGDKVGAFTIGIAGEKQFRIASIASMDMQNYPTRHAGRGGLGALMGSKKVKAIIVHPPKVNKIQYQNIEKFKSISKEWFKELHETKRVFSKYGTALMVSGMNATHGLPTKNFRRGSYDDWESISGDALNEFIVKNNGKFSVACSPGCAIRCSNIIRDKNGNHITSSLEYETIALNGSNLLINDIEKLAWIDHYYEDYGIDSIETGNCFAMYMESGLLKWGDSDGVIQLLKGIEKDIPESIDLGLGCYELGKKLGVQRIPHVKKQGFPGYDPRSYKGMGITFCTSPMAADHTAGPAIMKRKAYGDKNYGEESPWDPEHKAILSKELQIFIMIVDSMGLCYFVGPSYENTKLFSELVFARFGESMQKSADQWVDWGRDCILVEHKFNENVGYGVESDAMPDFIQKEPLEDIGRKWDVKDSEIDEFWTIL